MPANAKPLTQEQQDAINYLIQKNPFYWKSYIRKVWAGAATLPSNGNPPQVISFHATIYGLRNSHGPTWLARYRAQSAN